MSAIGRFRWKTLWRSAYLAHVDGTDWREHTDRQGQQGGSPDRLLDSFNPDDDVPRDHLLRHRPRLAHFWRQGWSDPDRDVTAGPHAWAAFATMCLSIGGTQSLQRWLERRGQAAIFSQM
jgi:hypothetical protein